MQARIVRIAVHPSLQRMGFGSAALQQLIDYFEGKGLSLQEPAEFAAFVHRREKQQQTTKQQQTKKERVSKMDGDIEDLDAEAGLSDPEDEETEQKETDEEQDTEAENGVSSEEDAAEETSPETPSERGRKGKERRDKKRHKETPPTPTVSLSEVKAEELRPRVTPPLLCPCSRSRPPFSIDYIGTSFGLTDQLFRFWSRKGFVPVYLRQQPSDVTGEHSCIMLRSAGAAPPSASGAEDAAEGDRRSRGLYDGIDAGGDPVSPTIVKL